MTHLCCFIPLFCLQLLTLSDSACCLIILKAFERINQLRAHLCAASNCVNKRPANAALMKSRGGDLPFTAFTQRSFESRRHWADVCARCPYSGGGAQRFLGDGAALVVARYTLKSTSFEGAGPSRGNHLWCGKKKRFLVFFGC